MSHQKRIEFIILQGKRIKKIKKERKKINKFINTPINKNKE
jgi:hypothetical protein